MSASIGRDLLERPVYSYTVTSAKVAGMEFLQTGSGPNFQGGRFTLCTCKHEDRASPPKKGCRGPNNDDPWRGVWVAGLCSATQRRPRALFYLMLVDQTCPSHAAAWKLLGSPLAKSAHRDRFGDIYEPRGLSSLDPWRQSSYKPSHANHVHDAKERDKDIERPYYGRHPCLLIGDPRRSYLWSKPAIALRADADAEWISAHHRFYPKLSDFLALCQ